MDVATKTPEAAESLTASPESKDKWNPLDHLPRNRAERRERVRVIRRAAKKAVRRRR